MKTFSALSCLSLLGLVAGDPRKQINVVVVSEENYKGGNCLGVGEDYVCSAPRDKIFNDISSSIKVFVDDSTKYLLGFTNQCHLSLTMASTIKIQWSKLTVFDVYFRDDQCFWSTPLANDPSGKYYKNEPLDDSQMTDLWQEIKILDDKGLALCLNDQIRLHPLEQTMNPFYLSQPANSNLIQDSKKPQGWPASPGCMDDSSLRSSSDMTQGEILGSASPPSQLESYDSADTGTYQANAALPEDFTQNTDSLQDFNINIRRRSRREVLPRQFIA